MSFENKKIAVVKVGGDMLLEESDRIAFAQNLRELNANGWSSVVLHGGGPQINSLQNAQGLSANKVDGRRITSEADLKVVKQALCGELNVDLVASLLAQNVNAFGFHGASGLALEANKRPPMMFENHGEIDLGEVGDVVKVNARLILDLLSLDLTPIIASLGVDQAGRTYNINADTTGAAVAKAVNADMLILCTKVGAIFENIKDPATRIAELSPRLAKQLIADKTIKDGMIPKVTEALSLLDRGVESIAIINADKPDNFIQMAAQSTQVGTRLIRD